MQAAQLESCFSVLEKAMTIEKDLGERRKRMIILQDLVASMHNEVSLLWVRVEVMHLSVVYPTPPLPSPPRPHPCIDTGKHGDLVPFVVAQVHNFGHAHT